MVNFRTATTAAVENPHERVSACAVGYSKPAILLRPTRPESDDGFFGDECPSWGRNRRVAPTPANDRLGRVSGRRPPPGLFAPRRHLFGPGSPTARGRMAPARGEIGRIRGPFRGKGVGWRRAPRARKAGTHPDP